MALNIQGNGSLVEFCRVSKQYKDVRALNEVSFSIRKGDVFGYIGPNGAGKTTTIKILVGLLRSYEGEVLFNGENVRNQLANLHKMLGYLPQAAGFQEWRTINHALTTFGRLSGLSGEYLESRIKATLDLVGLADVRFKKIANLSGGMNQKLGLAQALLHEPAFVVLDEPAAGLDPATRFQLKQIIKNLAKEGVTVFFSSHILSDVQDIANRIAILNFGRVLKVGTPDELQEHFRVGDVIRVVVKGSPQLSRIEAVPGVTRVEQPSLDVLLVHLTPNTDVDVVMPRILSLALEQKCRIRSIEIVKPSLEEVYLKFIGGDST